MTDPRRERAVPGPVPGLQPGADSGAADTEAIPTGPDRVLVLGGGRWARTILGVLLGIVPQRTRVAVCSPSGAAELRSWADGRGLRSRVEILAERPAEGGIGATAVIVANAARSHVASALWALGLAEAVLIEKPVALTGLGARRLVDAAKRRGRFLAPAQVLLFCRYLQAFAASLDRSARFDGVVLEWLDQRGERRDGEPKTYDAAIPVFADALPHVLNVLAAVFGQVPDRGMIVAVRRGGAEVALRLFLGGFHCDVILGRDAALRRRRLVVASRGARTSIDWSVEPGIIRDATGQRPADAHWSHGQRPLAQLLGTFLSSPSPARHDWRFGMASALNAATLTELLYPQYLNMLIEALASDIAAFDGTAGNAAEHIRYGVRELVQGDCAVTRAEAPSETACVLDRCFGMSKHAIRMHLERLAPPTLDCEPPRAP